MSRITHAGLSPSRLMSSLLSKGRTPENIEVEGKFAHKKKENNCSKYGNNAQIGIWFKYGLAPRISVPLCSLYSSPLLF